ncbi:MAG: hypothetical protein ACK4R8_09275 [Thiobacillus sp.]
MVIVLPFLTIINDIFSWYLTKMFPGFAWFIIISGVLMGISFAVQWVVSMRQMWFYTLPDDIGMRRRAAGHPAQAQHRRCLNPFRPVCGKACVR